MSKKDQYSFPTVSVCPRCRGTQTRAVSTQGRIQYRICRAPVCRYRYTVTGTLIKITKSKERKEQTNGQETTKSDRSDKSDQPAVEVSGTPGQTD